jgi:hypothetical protein
MEQLNGHILYERRAGLNDFEDFNSIVIWGHDTNK